MKNLIKIQNKDDFFNTKKVECNFRHVTCDMQVLSYNSLLVKVFWRFWGKGSLTDWLTDLMNPKAVFITALATPGLPNTWHSIVG